MKDWEASLIRIYFLVTEKYKWGLGSYTQRYSNNSEWQKLAFTDEEAITLYLYGLLQKRRTVKEIYDYSLDHLESWFPTIPSYQKFNARLNRLAPSIEQLSIELLNRLELPNWLLSGQNKLDAVIDSMPIMLAKGNRSCGAKIAKTVANKSYCASKKIWYHGVKLHCLGVSNPKKLPIPMVIEFSRASENDNTVFKETIAPKCRYLRVYGDKIYNDEAVWEELNELYGIEVFACKKRKRGQQYLFADQNYYNTMVSQIRQPIEAFFNWLEQKVHIQVASKVRSTKGLFKHLFGRLAAALLSLFF